jgi:molybdopterin-guanine dinucleotide biosynthesis protein
MQKSEILKLIDKDTLIIEVFRRARVQKVVTIESESSVPNEASNLAINEATESIEKTPIRQSIDIRRNKLVSKSSTDSKKKHLTFSNDEVNHENL